MAETPVSHWKIAADFLVGVAWPVVVVASLAMFRPPLIRLIDRIKSASFEKGKVTLELNHELSQAEERAAAKPGRAETPDAAELAQANRVAAQVADTSALLDAAQRLADEYASTRAFNLPGATRTRKLEGIVAKMRALGRALFPHRFRYLESHAPGERLLAIAALQITPDYDLLDWVAARILAERPFVSYHALLALLVAARDGEQARAHRAALNRAQATIEAGAAAFANDPDRLRRWHEFKRLAAEAQA